MKNKLVVSALLSAVFAGSASADVQFAPYLNAELYGGRTHFSGDNVNGLNGSALFVPGMRFGERFSVLPSAFFGYRQAQDVQELAGGGFLTQKAQDMGGGVKGIYDLTPAWKAKA